MKKFLAYIQSEIEKGVDSPLILRIVNNISLKNRNACQFTLSSKMISYLLSIAKSDFPDELLSIDHAEQSLISPCAHMESSIGLSLTGKSSFKQNAINALIEFKNTFYDNISTAKLRDSIENT